MNVGRNGNTRHNAAWNIAAMSRLYTITDQSFRYKNLNFSPISIVLLTVLNGAELCFTHILNSHIMYEIYAFNKSCVRVSYPVNEFDQHSYYCLKRDTN